MVITSSLRLVLYALATALLTDAIGLSSLQLADIKLNTTLMINQKPLAHKKIILNLNGPPLVNTVTELQSVFQDKACRSCIKCMERTIKTFRAHSHIVSNRPREHELYYELVNKNGRYKRNIVTPKEKTMEKGKSFRATVTKYTKDKKVYAMEVNENDATNTCKLYSVKKVLPCDSGIDLISASKRKLTKKSKKIKDTTKATVTAATDTVKSKLSVYKKREVDNSQLLESFMPSIEELY